MIGRPLFSPNTIETSANAEISPEPCSSRVTSKVGTAFGVVLLTATNNNLKPSPRYS